MIVCLCHNVTLIIYIELVIVLRTCHFCDLKACTKLQTLYRRDTENKLSYRVFKSVKDRRADTGWNIDSDTFYNSANAVLILSCLVYLLYHFVALNVDNSRELFLTNFPYHILSGIDRVKSLILYAMDFCDMSAHIDTSFFKYLTCHCSCKA